MSLSNSTQSQEPIAIVGIGCRLPGDINSINDFNKRIYEKKKDENTTIVSHHSSSFHHHKSYTSERSKSLVLLVVVVVPSSGGSGIQTYIC